jgi:hypothetical protein
MSATTGRRGMLERLGGESDPIALLRPVTASPGVLSGRRVVRGREPARLAHHHRRERGDGDGRR